jgi:UTP:GlnB (protein PII) uridylyltransferase
VVVFTSESINTIGERVEDTLRVENPELEKWLEEHVENLNGIEFERA